MTDLTLHACLSISHLVVEPFLNLSSESSTRSSRYERAGTDDGWFVNSNKDYHQPPYYSKSVLMIVEEKTFLSYLIPRCKRGQVGSQAQTHPLSVSVYRCQFLQLCGVIPTLDRHIIVYRRYGRKTRHSLQYVHVPVRYILHWHFK
jgi:hypothetical protein